MTDLPSDDTKKIDDQATGGKPARAKEQAVGTQEKTPITEFTRKVDLEPEVEGWLEKLEKEDASLPQPVVDDTSGQTVLDEADKADDKGKFKVVLPLTKTEVEKGLHHKVIDGARWLAEWCIRMIKMFGNKVAYKRTK